MFKSDSAHGYFPVKDQAIAAGFYLTGAGMERVEANGPYPLPSHPDMYKFSWNTGRILPEYALVYIDSGEGVFESHETGVVRIQAGMAILLMPDVWHRYRPIAKTGWVEYWITFNGQLPHFWQQAGVIAPITAVRTIIWKDVLGNRLRQIIQAAVANLDDGFEISFSAMAALADVFAGGTRPACAPQDQYVSTQLVRSEDALVNAALGIIWNYSHRNLLVRDIARQLGVTRRTLERRFQKARKNTVLNEVTTCRLSRAQRMLLETHLPIKRVAYAAGFSTPEYLATVFRHELNMTPTQYRLTRIQTSPDETPASISAIPTKRRGPSR